MSADIAVPVILLTICISVHVFHLYAFAARQPSEPKWLTSPTPYLQPMALSWDFAGGQPDAKMEHALALESSSIKGSLLGKSFPASKGDGCLDSCFNHLGFPNLIKACHCQERILLLWGNS